MQLQELRQHLDQEGFSKLPALIEKAIKLVETGVERHTCMALAQASEGDYGWREFRPILSVYETLAFEGNGFSKPVWWGSFQPFTQERLRTLSFFLGAVRVHVACQLARERALAG